MAHEQRRLAAIVSIDVVGYSRLMGQNESGTHALLKTHLTERVMPSLGRHGGRLVKSTGDGVLAEFGSTVSALSALVAVGACSVGTAFAQNPPAGTHWVGTWTTAPTAQPVNGQPSDDISPSTSVPAE